MPYKVILFFRYALDSSANLSFTANSGVNYALFDLKTPRISLFYYYMHTNHTDGPIVHNLKSPICIIYSSYFVIYYPSGYYERFASANAHNGERRNRGCELASPFTERSVAHTACLPEGEATGFGCCLIIGSRADVKLTVPWF